MAEGNLAPSRILFTVQGFSERGLFSPRSQEHADGDDDSLAWRYRMVCIVEAFPMVSSDPVVLLRRSPAGMLRKKDAHSANLPRLGGVSLGVEDVANVRLQNK